MSPELDLALCKKYPELFKDRYADMRATAMCWGFDCGDGWYALLDALCGSLQWDIDNNKHPQIVVTQVKEKYGTLRFYTDISDDRQNGMISFAEKISGLICETCGNPGKLYGTGWVYTACEKHKRDE